MRYRCGTCGGGGISEAVRSGTVLRRCGDAAVPVQRRWTDDQRQMWKEYAVVAGSPRKQPLRLCDGGDSSERSDAEEDAFSLGTSPELQEHDPYNNEASVSSVESGRGTSEIRDDDSIAVMIMGTLNTPPKTNPTSSPGNSASTDSTTPCPILCLGCQWVSQGDHSGGQWGADGLERPEHPLPQPTDDHGFAHHTNWWIQSLSLEPTPEAVSLINETLEKMDDMRPRNIGQTHWQNRVGAVGRVILYLLAIQYELGEVFDLSGQILLDILNGSISPLNQDWRNVFFFMYLATDPEELRHKDTFNMDTFTANRNSFYSEHVIYDPTIRLPKFERLYPSRNTGMTPISITVTDAADAEFHGKRKGNNEQAESLRPAKRQDRKLGGGGGGRGVMRKIKGREQRSQGSFDRKNGEAAV
ncbi:hypothetical protein B0H14DRAFT_3147830 [Mycena olivaceomarginata]|nr:hypothetical protein B0H14DRAFT_3147830 [Mycena olivaceomarginata]